MKKKQILSQARTWIGIALLSLGMSAGAEPKQKITVTDKTTVRNPKADAQVTTQTHGTQTRTTEENGRWQTVKAETQSKTTETRWNGDWTENGWEGEAGIKADKKSRLETKTGNSSTRALGKTKLEEPETLWEGAAGKDYRKTVKGDLGTVSIKAEAGTEGSVRRGDNGVEAKGKIGVETELKATTPTIKAGTKDFGLSLKGQAKLEASAVAKGQLGAYVDEKGITFGAEGSAGVYVKGELKLSMEAHVFGVKTNVNLIASGYAGAMVAGKAVATLGWNGKVSFMASLGASIGFGGGVAVEFEMDAEELMKRLNFTDLSQLLVFLKEFQENPEPALAKLGIQALRKLHESGFGVLRKLGQNAAKTFENKVLEPLQMAGEKLHEGAQKGLAFLGRLIRAPHADSDLGQVNAVIAQSEENRALLTHSVAGRSQLEFPLCLGDGSGRAPLQEDWEGMDPYSWHPFDWPSAYAWPSL
jgi:hypothetical protein